MPTRTPATRRLVLTALAALAGATLGSQAHAQAAYPNKTVKIIVPFTAGGSSDVQGRMLADALGGFLQIFHAVGAYRLNNVWTDCLQ